MKKLWLALGLCGLLVIPKSPASAELITFDELSQRALDGVSLKGVTFGFTINGVSSTDANFGTTTGPGGVAPFIVPPNVEGNSLGVLSFTFATAASQVQFGLARNVPVGTTGATVELFSGTTTLGSSDVIVSIPAGGTFPEGLFSSSATNVTSGRITFSNPGTAPRFAIDNFGFSAGPVVPEPASLILLGLGGSVGTVWNARRRRASAAGRC